MKRKREDNYSDSESETESEYDKMLPSYVYYNQKKINIENHIEKVCNGYYYGILEDCERYYNDFNYGKCLLCNYNYIEKESCFANKKICYFSDCDFCKNEEKKIDLLVSRWYECDHDHDDEQVDRKKKKERFRGLLCNTCNLKEGHWKRNKNLIDCPLISSNYHKYLINPDMLRNELPEYILHSFRKSYVRPWFSCYD